MCIIPESQRDGSKWGILKRLTTSRPYVIRGVSMALSLMPGEQALVDVSAYRASVPERGDIVALHAPNARGRRDVKRVIGLPGERVALREGMLYVNGRELAEPYLGGLPSSIGLGEASWRLGVGEYILLGDNRAHSTDSRSYGPVDSSRIIGRVWLRYWPPARFGVLDYCPPLMRRP